MLRWLVIAGTLCACDPGSPGKEPGTETLPDTEVVDTDTEETDTVDTDTVETDTVDTDAPPAVLTRVGTSGGGGAVTGATLRGRVVLGAPLTVHELRGARHRGRLGLGTTQIVE